MEKHIEGRGEDRNRRAVRRLGALLVVSLGIVDLILGVYGIPRVGPWAAIVLFFLTFGPGSAFIWLGFNVFELNAEPPESLSESGGMKILAEPNPAP